jgi:hypothetical protein
MGTDGLGGGRRERQLIEMLLLFAHGDRRRAACLALEHSMEFPTDAAALVDVAAWFEGVGPEPAASAGHEERDRP